MKCLCCEGVGKQTAIEISIVDVTRELNRHEIPCIWCSGTGNMDEKQKCDYVGYMDIWCKCGKHWDTTFFDDFADPLMEKHHYKCNRCGKVTQIG